MGQCGKVQKGDDKIILIADDQGNCDLPIMPATDLYWTLPLTVAAAIAPGANSLTVGTIPPGLTRLLIRKGFTIGVQNPGQSFTIPVKLAADFLHTTATAGTTLDVEDTPEPILPGANFTYPVRVGLVTSANPGRARQTVQGNANDADGYKPSSPGTATATIALTMDTDDTDAGQLNVDYFQDKGETCILIVYNPIQRSTIKRKRQMGIGYFSEFNGTLQNDATPTLTTTFNFDRRPSTLSAQAA